MTVSAAAGDEPAVVPTEATFEDFYEREYSRLVRLGYVLTGSRSLAEEMSQETMLRVLRHWSKVKDYEHQSAWARRVLCNLATSRGRRLTVEARVMVKLRGERPSEPAPTAETNALWEAVRALPKREAQAIALHYLEDLDVAAIALVMDAPENTIKSLLRRGRQRLAERLGEDEQ